MTEPRILSVCMTLPSNNNPANGIFVYRRLQAIASRLPTLAIRPQPWFPVLRPHVASMLSDAGNLTVESKPMFYVPGVAKCLDGMWMERAIREVVRSEISRGAKVILDAHFGYPEGVACSRLAKTLGVPLVITLRGVEEDWVKSQLTRIQLSTALRSASAVIAVSRSLANLAISQGVQPGRLHVIPNGCDTSVFFRSDRNSARKTLGLSSERPLVVSVARIHPVKGIDILLEALANHFGGFDGELLLIGGRASRAYYLSLQKLISRVGLENRVRFIDAVAPDQVALYLQAADLFALASHREGCCNAVIEAMACGTPVVTTEVGDNPEFAKQYKNMLLVPPGDPVALGATMKRMLDAIGMKKVAEPPFFTPSSWDEVGEQCAGVFRGIVGSGEESFSKRRG